MKRLLIVLALLAVAITPAFAQDSGRTTITADNASNLSQLIRLGRGSALAVEWSPDGSQILVGGSLGIWKYDATALDTQSEPELIELDGEIDHFAVNPVSGMIAVSPDRSSLLEWRDLATGEVTNSIEIENSSQRLTYSPDGTLVAMNKGSYGIVIYSGGEIFTEVTASLNPDVNVMFSPDGTQLIAANTSYDILVWDLEAGGEPITLEGHTSTINDMAISPDGSTLVTASADDSFIFWDLTSGELIETISLAEESFSLRDVYSVTFSPDGNTLLTGHSAVVRAWDVATRTVTNEITVGISPIKDLSYSPDGSQFVALVPDQDSAIQLLNADGTFVAQTAYHNAIIDAVTFSPDSAILTFNDTDGYLYLWDTATIEEITFATRIDDAATFGLDNLSNITYSSDNQYLAVLDSFSFTLRNPVTGELILEVDDVDGIAEDIEFSPDNTLIAFITSQGLYIFDVASGTRLAFFDDADDWMNDVTWSPDQTMIATAASDNAVRIYTVQ